MASLGESLTEYAMSLTRFSKDLSVGTYVTAALSGMRP